MTDRRLIHYSAKPLLAVESVTQTDDSSFKPNGLWLSVEGEDDWLHWCQSERWGLSNLVTATEIKLAPGANILRLRTAEDIDRLTVEYASAFIYHLRWDKIAAKYQGIIIAPYIWRRRLTPHTSWYYGWDCASGCIWDAHAVAELKRLDWDFKLDEKEAS